MSDRDLRNLYESVRRGDEYVAPKRENELYNNVYHRVDEETKLRFIHPDTGKEVIQRVSDEYVRKYLVPDLDYKGESIREINSLIEHGIDAGVFNETGVDANTAEVRVFWNWITESIPKTGNLLRTFFTDQGLHNISMADTFVNSLLNGARFNMFKVAEQALQSIGWSGITISPDESIVKIRPMSNAYATRGAAGPGEALMAFLFNGQKPEVGDLAIEWSQGNAPLIVELKYKGGRIGKGIDMGAMKRLAKNEGMFHNLQTTQVLSGQVKDVNKLKDTYNDNFIEMLRDLAGVEIPDAAVTEFIGFTIEQFLEQAGTKHGIYGDNPYMLISQYIGAAHAKDYTSQIAPFDVLSVFDDAGNVGSINYQTIVNGTLHDIVSAVVYASCIFKPKLDKEGFQIMLKEYEKIDSDTDLDLKIDIGKHK